MFIKHKTCKTELEWHAIKNAHTNNIEVTIPWCPRCHIEVAVIDMTPKPKGSLSAWPIKQ